MTETQKRTPRAPLALTAAALAALALFLLAAPVAQADYEQVGRFGYEGEGAQQTHKGVAVNTSGAGLPASEADSVYIAGEEEITRYSPTGEFREAWGWYVGNRGEEGFQRCGPALETDPAQGTYHTCLPLPRAHFHPEGVGYFNSPSGVAVDQATGYVYVLNEALFNAENERTHNLVEVFSADGSEVIARFGDEGDESSSPGESIEEGPEKLHDSRKIAVDEAGRVYLTDLDVGGIATTREARVLTFEPKEPGDYEEYVYSGRSSDIKAGPYYYAFTDIGLDNAGHLYVTRWGRVIEEYSLAEPAVPVCTFTPPERHLESLGVNPASGEVFFIENSPLLRRLSPCSEGSFEEAQVPAALTPGTKQMRAIAVNPSLRFSPARPPGIAYGADYGFHEGTGIYAFAPAEFLLPVVESESVTATGTSSSVLRAEIDPRGHGTSYRFQYLTQAQYEANGESFEGAMEAPPGGGRIGGSAKATAAAAISGLAPDTMYRFRMVASSECAGAGEPPCEALGEAASFSTYPATAFGLPDGRAYELVSPPKKNGGEVFPIDPEGSYCCKPSLTFASAMPEAELPRWRLRRLRGICFLAQ